LEPFRAHFGERDCSDVTPEAIREYLIGLSGSAGTKRLKFFHIRALFEEGQQALIESEQPIKWANPCLFLKADFKIPRHTKTPVLDTIHEDMREVKKTLKANTC